MSEISEAVGKRIKEFRNARKYSQEELAYRASIAPSYLGLVERGVKKPTVETLDKLVKALGITFIDLFDFSKNSKPRESSVVESINFELNNLSAEEQELIHKFIKQLILFKNIGSNKK